MLKKKGFITILIAGLLIFATNVFALSPGTPFTFGNAVLFPVGNTWTHSLSNADFTPNLSGSEPLIINYGYLFLNLTFTPTQILPGVYLYAVNPYIDSNFIGNTFIYGSKTPGTFTANWFTPITDPSALNAIADKNATISLHPITPYGNLNSVNVSVLSGGGTVAPEPVSMLLVGVGIAGLPVARRFRRFMSKG